MPAIVFSGVPGAGKSTVIDSVCAQSEWKAVNIGTELLRLAVAEGLAKDRDELRKLPAVVLQELREKTARSVPRNDKILIDSHVTVRGQIGYQAAFPDAVARHLELAAVVLIEADPAQILARRLADGSRVRDDETERQIADHQNHNRSAAWALAARNGMIVCTVRNDGAGPSVATAESLRILGHFG